MSYLLVFLKAQRRSNSEDIWKNWQSFSWKKNADFLAFFFFFCLPAVVNIWKKKNQVQRKPSLQANFVPFVTEFLSCPLLSYWVFKISLQVPRAAAFKNKLSNMPLWGSFWEVQPLPALQKPYNNYIHRSWIRIIEFRRSDCSANMLSSCMNVEGYCLCFFSVVSCW